MERGWIEIFEGSLLEGGVTALPANLAREALQAAAAWDLPGADARELLIAATRAGEEPYARRALEPLP